MMLISIDARGGGIKFHFSRGFVHKYQQNWKEIGLKPYLT